MKRAALLPALATLLLPASSWAGAEGPGTPQATAANATFLSNAPAPPTGRGVCVIDTGVDTDTDLGPALLQRVAQLNGVSGDPSDQGAIGDAAEALPKHGTYVSGIIASQADGAGTSGIWPVARLYSNRVFAAGGATTVNDYRRAIAWCSVQPGVKVINLSLSGLANATTSERTNLDNKIAEVRGAPYFINVVAAAGNNGSAVTVGYPAAAQGVFAVGATDAHGQLATFSNRGFGLDIAAFGTETCVTTAHGTRLAVGSGTSYAAPVVSAVLAALRSYDPTLDPDEAEHLLVENADTVAGIRVLNAANAFRASALANAVADAAPSSGIDARVINPCEVPAPLGTPSATSASGKPESEAPAARPSVQAVLPDAPVPVIDVVAPPPLIRRVAAPPAPVLRSVNHRRGLLTLRINGYAPGDLVRYRVTYRARGKLVSATFVRRSGTLRVRLANWATVRVQLSRPRQGTSRTLVVRTKSEF